MRCKHLICLATLKSSDTMKLSVCGWQDIYACTPPTWLLSSLAKELMAATRIMQITSNEFSTPVSESAKCKQTKSYTCALTFWVDIQSPNDWTVYNWSNIKIGRFWSHLEVSSVSSHTKELWCNETVCLCIYIYIYIYIYTKYIWKRCNI